MSRARIAGAALAAALGVASWGFAAEPSARAPADAGAPRVSIEPPEFDFGRALQRRRLEKRFRIRNFGGRDLVIGQIVSNCDCTVVQLSDDERTVPPGESVDLHVTLHTRREVGRVSRRVVIETNDPENERVEVRLEADVRPAPIQRRR